MKISALIDDFSTYLKTKNFSARTIRTYVCYTGFLDSFLKKCNVSDIRGITRELISRYQTSLCTKNEYNPRMLCVKTQCLRMVAVINFCKYLHKYGHSDNHLASHVELPRLPKSLPKSILSRREVLKILKTPGDDDPLEVRDKAILELLYSTGIRNSEMRNIKIYDVDFARGFIKVKGKGDRERIIPVGEVAGWYMQEYIHRSRPKLIRAETDILFVSKNGRQFTDDMPAWIVQKYAGIAGITRHINAHTFRHTFATHMIQKGANLRIVQEMLGHMSLETTQLYTKVEIGDLKKVHSRTHPREVDLV